MRVSFLVNGSQQEWEVAPGDRLLETLRAHGYYGVKDGGCQHAECGACAVLLDGRPVNSCAMLAAQADGHTVQTIESLGQHPEQGWRKTPGLDPIQQAFIESGAIQCGYCTPGPGPGGPGAAAAKSQPNRGRGP